jgi:isoquinoline 1-oxidoreductase beta subunit
MLATRPRTSLRPSRRGFLKSSALAAAGLTLGFHVPTGRLTSALAAEALPGPFHGYLTIGLDGTVTVRAAHMDMGQGIYTGTATLVAEELDADWAQMRAEGGWGNPKLFGNLAWGGEIQGTGGSTGTASSFLRYRQAGAAARAMLIEAAARMWGVPTDGITVESGLVRHPHGKQASFAELAPKAAIMPVPAEVRLKDPSQWRYIGNPELRRLDSVAKTRGTQEFTIDVRLPGMLTAVIAHPPRFGGKVASFDATAARSVKGVVDVVQIPSGVAVVAETTWAALKGREALAVTWDESAAETRGTAELTELYRCCSTRMVPPSPAPRVTRARRSPGRPRSSPPTMSSPTSPTRRSSRSTPWRGCISARSRYGAATRCPTSTSTSRRRRPASSPRMSSST